MAEVVQIKSLYPGLVLRQALFSRQGIKLLPAGTRLSDGVCRALRSSGEPSFVLAATVAEIAGARPATGAVPRRLGRLADGPMLTLGGRLALTTGQELERHHAQALAPGAFDPLGNGTDDATGGGLAETLFAPDAADDEHSADHGDGDGTANGHAGRSGRPWAVRHDQLNRVRATMLRLSDQVVEERARLWETFPRSVPTGIEPVELAVEDEPGFPDRLQLAALRTAHLERCTELLGRIVAGVPVDLSEPQSIVAELMALLSRWPRRYAQLALPDTRLGDDLPEQMYTTCVLSIGLAARAGWSRAHTATAGVAGLLADAGMGLIPLNVRRAARSLDETETNRIRRHPALGVVLLEAVVGLPEAVLVACHQHHERNDATGYPRALPAGRIHPLAKLVAVADVFASLTAPRPHRRAIKPYDAMEKVVSIAATGRLERSFTRTLVTLCGLFPVGSWVRLSDSTIARVVAAHTTLIDRPVVQRYEAGRPGEVIDLTTLQPWELSVIQCLEPEDIAA